MIYNIMYCSNEAYSPKLAVSIASLLDSNKDIINEMHIIIRTNDITEDTKNRLRDMIFRYGMKAEQLDFTYTDKLFEKLENWNMKKFKNNYMCYLKLFDIDGLIKIDENILSKRILIIDADTLILNSLKGLFETELDEKPVGAVMEFPTKINAHMDGTTEYNTGVLLFDTCKYKEMELENKFRKAVSMINEAEWHTGDQLVFSKALEREGLIKRLPLKYNFIMNQVPFSYDEFCYYRDIKPYEKEADKMEYYDRSLYEDARDNTCILHLISGVFILSPWYYESTGEIKDKWEFYLEKSGFRNKDITIYEHISPGFWAMHVLFSIFQLLPRRLCMGIFRLAWRLGAN